MAHIGIIRQYMVPDDPRVRREMRALADAGHTVEVICMRGLGQSAREVDGSIEIHRLPMSHRRGGTARYIWEYIAFPVLAAMYVARLDRRRRFDLVQVHTVPDWLVFAAVVPRRRGAKVLLDLHECVPEFFATKSGTESRHWMVRMLGYLERASIRFATHAITCTEQMKEAFVSRGSAPERIDVVMNSAEESVFDPGRHHPRPRQPERFTLISHGSLEERYGVDTAIRAVNRLRDRIPGLTLEVYGEGSAQEELERLVDELALQQHVRFHGYVPIDDLVAAIADADAGVVAMKPDAFRHLTHCNKMFDLITMRRPVICSRTRSVAAYFPPTSLHYFEGDDDADLARAIEALHADPGLADRLVAGATETNETYRWPNQRQHYLSIVESVLASARPARAAAQPAHLTLESVGDPHHRTGYVVHPVGRREQDGRPRSVDQVPLHKLTPRDKTSGRH